MKPDNPIVYNEFYLDVMTGGSSELPAPVTPEQHYLAHLAGMTVNLPQPIILRDMFLAKICGMDVDVPTYIPGKFPRKFAYYAKAAGQDVDVPQPITREEMYWADYVSEPSEKEYTGAVPVTFKANGQPLLDYLISGNTIQNGTPTPDSPVMPQGTGERTGNLLNPNITRYEKAYSDRIVDFSGGAMYIVPIKSNTTYTIKTYSDESIEVFHIGLYNKPVPESGDTVDNIVRKSGVNPTATITNTDYEYLMIQISGAYINNYGLADTVLNEGSEPLPYEPYGYKIPISSASTTTPVYLGEVETTRKVRKLVLTGQESWSQYVGTNSIRYTRSSTIHDGMPMSQIISSHFKFGGFTASDGRNGEVTGTNATNLFRIFLWSDISTVTDFKSYLAQQYANGTPVTVWYVLAEPETGIVNEPLMKIGEYTDTLSMEQTGIEIPTARGTNTLDVLTDVKPSEVYIKYKE